MCQRFCVHNHVTSVLQANGAFSCITLSMALLLKPNCEIGYHTLYLFSFQWNLSGEVQS